MNDFLMAAASATADAPNPAAVEVLAEAGLDVADEIAATPAFAPVRTANPNRTKAPTPQEVDR
ncbi:hypothetical protein [Lentzea californiensis]|uniref:hypothetical protein n=1 Tax=Lentzea californiensis TaxID=438851 RepID=UPI0021649852|nr:hypothetical protein [Lentzea californiensis]MCR3748741.1 hypothetical protein [Lentzea californiensis]